MKRLIASLLALPLIVAFAVSCDRTQIEEEESVVIEGLQDQLEFTAVPTGDVTFTITSNVNWSIAQKNLDWVSITPSTGNGTGKSVTVVVAPEVNTAYEPREGSFTVTAGKTTRTVTVSQAAAVAEPVFNVDGVEGDTFYIEGLNVEGASFNVSSNKDWTAEVTGVSWATVSPLSGVKDQPAVISVVPKSVNESETREGTIAFNYGADAPKVIKLVHKKFEAELALSVSELTATATAVFQNPVVTVTANGPWTAEISDNWIAVDKEEGVAGETQVTVYVRPNETGADRSGTVTFTNRSKTAVLTVRQSNEFVKASVEKISTSELEATFEVSANVDWTITSSEAWATVTPAEGNSDATVKVTMAELPAGTENRTAKLTIAAKNIEGLSAVVDLEQKKPVAVSYINLYDTPVLFCSNNQAWNMEKNPDYATNEKTGAVSGLGTGRLLSYSHYDNEALYMQFESPNQYGPMFIMAAEGNITAQNVWTDDAFAFHIPAARIEAGHVLNIEYGLYGTKAAPAYWNSEVSFDGGSTWTTFTTGHEYTTPVAQASANSFAGTKDKSEVHVLGKCEVPATVENAEIIVRVRCADGARGIGGSDRETPSTSGTIRLIGGEGHDVENNANAEPVMGPKIYVTTGSAEFVPELSVSISSVSVQGTSATFDVVSNTDWVVTASEEWVTVSPAEGSGNKTVTVKMAQLEEGAANRTATISVAAKNYPQCTASVSVEQIAPEPSGPVGAYVDLAATPVLFCSNNYTWNITNNPDYASSGMTGGGKVEGEGTGAGSGRLKSYSHLENKDVFMQYEDSPVEFQTAQFIMAAEGNITARKIWTDDAFAFHIPAWKLTAGKTLCFDFQIYCKGSTTPKYWAVEVSFDGGQTYTMFDTGVTGESSPRNNAAANFVIAEDEGFWPVAATYALSENKENVDMIVRFRAVDGAYSIAVNSPEKTSPGNGAVRIFGYEQTTLAGDPSVVSGPTIYIK
jgi:hypothetical protein